MITGSTMKANKKPMLPLGLARSPNTKLAPSPEKVSTLAKPEPKASNTRARRAHS